MFAATVMPRTGTGKAAIGAAQPVLRVMEGVPT